MTRLCNAFLRYRYVLLLAVVLSPCIAAESNVEEVIELADEWAFESQGKGEFDFELPAVPEDRQVRLSFDARIDWIGTGGYRPGMGVRLNGEAVAGRFLLNKPLVATRRNGGLFQWASRHSGGYILFYGKDFSDDTRDFMIGTYRYGLADENQDPFRFVWDITSLVHPGTNTLTLTGTTMRLADRDFGTLWGDVRIETGPPVPSLNPDVRITPAPTGTLEVYVPKKASAAGGRDTADVQDNTLRVKGFEGGMPVLFEDEAGGIYASTSGTIRVISGGYTFDITSRTSLPDGKWIDRGEGTHKWEELRREKAFSAAWEGHGYRVERTITLRPDHIAVSDTVSNTGDELVGVIYENRLGLPLKPEKVLMGGVKSPMKRGGSLPTVAVYKDMAVGMSADDDILRIHGGFKQEEDAIVLMDRSLGIAPGGSHTLEWSVYAIPGGDYWDFMNAVRRNWGLNFTMEGPLDFYCQKRLNYAKYYKPFTADDVREWLAENNNSLSWVMTHVGANPSVPVPGTPERPSRVFGTGILDPKTAGAELAWIKHASRLATLLKEVAPDVKFFAFMHPNFCSEVGYLNKYRDSVALRGDGTPILKNSYRCPTGVFIPTAYNSYGKALKKVYEYFVEEIGANIYLDETAVAVPGRAPYEQWDGCTVTIDPETHAVTGKQSMTFLLMQTWYAEMIEYLRSKNRIAMFNYPPPTRTMSDWKMQHFFEDVGPGGCIKMHFSTPLQFAYRRGIKGFHHLMESLSYGNIAFTRGGDWSDHMFPITPIELRPGIVFAEERILTNRSGRFGWGDDSEAHVYMFNGNGEPVEHPDVKQIREGGQVFTDIRMPSDHLAILVRNNKNQLSSGSN